MLRFRDNHLISRLMAARRDAMMYRRHRHDIHYAAAPLQSEHIFLRLI